MRTLVGLPASPGVACGKVRRIRDEADAHLVGEGEIAVAEVLPASWLPLLAHAAGVVAAKGGALCNAAILLRELRIPAVMDVPGALELFIPGERLAIDGSVGQVVRLADRAPRAEWSLAAAAP